MRNAGTLGVFRVTVKCCGQRFLIVRCILEAESSHLGARVSIIRKEALLPPSGPFEIIGDFAFFILPSPYYFIAETSFDDLCSFCLFFSFTTILSYLVHMFLLHLPAICSLFI